MSHHSGGGEASIAAAASAGAYETLAGQAAPVQRRELTQEDIDRRKEASERLAKMEPVGKTIDFEEGVSRATVRYARGIFPFAHPGEHDLAGVSGQVIDAAVGAVTERGAVIGYVQDPAELVLRVYVKGSLWPPKFPHDYIVRDSEARYSLH